MARRGYGDSAQFSEKQISRMAPALQAGALALIASSQASPRLNPDSVSACQMYMYMYIPYDKWSCVCIAQQKSPRSPRSPRQTGEARQQAQPGRFFIKYNVGQTYKDYLQLCDERTAGTGPPLVQTPFRSQDAPPEEGPNPLKSPRLSGSAPLCSPKRIFSDTAVQSRKAIDANGYIFRFDPGGRECVRARRVHVCICHTCMSANRDASAHVHNASRKSL